MSDGGLVMHALIRTSIHTHRIISTFTTSNERRERHTITHQWRSRRVLSIKPQTFTDRLSNLVHSCMANSSCAYAVVMAYIHVEGRHPLYRDACRTIELKLSGQLNFNSDFATWHACGYYTMHMSTFVRRNPKANALTSEDKRKIWMNVKVDVKHLDPSMHVSYPRLDKP
jgi:hypothetical protein